MRAVRGVLGLLLSVLLCAGAWWAVASWEAPPALSQTMVVSLSSDGHHAISSHRERELVLWDIRARSHRLISREANIYSAYFIPGTDAFLWQNLSDVVRVQQLDGTVLQTFPHFPTYGHAITADLATYVSSDIGWGIYLGRTADTRPLKATDGQAFLGYGKLLNLRIDRRTGALLSAGDGLLIRDQLSIAQSTNPITDDYLSDYNGVVLWDLSTGQPLHKLPGNAAKTHATLSPDGKFVVSVDENGKSFVWETSTGMRPYRPSALGSGIFNPSDTGLGDFDPAGMRLTYPADFPPGFSGGAQLGVHFVDAEHYVILHTYHPYAVLYTLGDPFAVKILALGEAPFPSVSSYLRNAAIASAPEAGILVTGQREGGGINVYRFDSRTRSLERIWAPTP